MIYPVAACRFDEHTNSNLASCVDYLEAGELPESDSERRALRNLVELARQIVEMADDWLDDELVEEGRTYRQLSFDFPNSGKRRGVSWTSPNFREAA